MQIIQSLGLLALLSSTALSIVHDVDVGNGGLVFNPDSIKAKVGDHVNFHFYAGEHSVAESLFKSPCAPSGPKAIYSGFQNPSGSSEEAKLMFSMRVNTTDPIWLYCSQVEHCQNGMSMVINPPAPSTGKTLAKYMSNSKGVSGSSPAKIFGGVLEPNKDSDASVDKS